MPIEDIIRETVETISLVPSLAGIPVIEESKGDVDKELQLKVAKSKVCIMVGWSGFTPVVQGATAPNGGLFGSVTVVVSVFEKPVVNRSTAGTPSVFEIAKTVAMELHGASADGMDAPLFLRKITPVSELGSGSDGSVVTCDVEFETKTSL